MNNLKETLISVLHIKTRMEVIFNFIFSLVGIFLGSMKVLCFENMNIFMAVTLVIFGDFVAGVGAAIKQHRFETQKLVKVLYYLVSYNALAAIILQIEKGFPSAFFLSEAFLLPLIVALFISMVKNLSLVGLVPTAILQDLLAKVDQHKDLNLSNNNTKNP